MQNGENKRLTERLLGNNSRRVRRIINNRRLHRKPTRISNVPTKHKLIPINSTILKEALDDVVLHLVLHRAQHHARLTSGTNLPALHDVQNSFLELLVDVCVHIKTLGSYTQLSGVEECAEGDEGSNLVDVDVRT